MLRDNRRQKRDIQVRLTGLAAKVGWTPFLYLSIVCLGFVTWEAGLIGIETPNSKLKRFNNALKKGKHVLMVDVDHTEERTLLEVAERHPDLRMAGTEAMHFGWMVSLQRNWQNFLRLAP